LTLSRTRTPNAGAAGDTEARASPISHLDSPSPSIHQPSKLHPTSRERPGVNLEMSMCKVIPPCGSLNIELISVTERILIIFPVTWMYGLDFAPAYARLHADIHRDK
jgi:hypothetical protein